MPSIETLAALNFDASASPVAASKASTTPAPRRAPEGRSQRLRRAELIQLSTQLCVMLETGVTITSGLRCIADQSDKPHVQRIINGVATSVEQGEDFSAAVARHPRSFPRIYVALIKASEKSGMLPRMINRATTYLRDEEEILRKVKGAMTYPGIMFGFALMTSMFMLAFVLPRFAVIYKGKEHALPVPTKILMGMSDFLVSYWMYLIPGVAIAAYLAWQWLRTSSGQDLWHRVQLRLPLIGPMFRKLHLSRGLRMIGTLAGAGVSLVDCLETAEGLAGNRRYAALWAGVGHQIRQGRPFSESLRSNPLVPPAVAQMLHSGETGGKLAQVTERVAEHAEQELKEAIAEVTRYIEPAMIVLMGGLIGGVTMALLLPVFTISRVVAQ